MQKSFSIAPLSSLAPVYIRIDNIGLKMFNNNKEMPFTDLLNEKAEKLCKRKEIGRSFQTDGSQAILQYIELKTITLRRTREKVQERREKKRKLEWENW